MHIADSAKGMLGAIGDVGSNVPMATRLAIESPYPAEDDLLRDVYVSYSG